MRIRRWYFVAANVVTLMFIVTYHVLSNTPPPKQMTLNASAQKGPALRSAERTELQLGPSTCGPQSSSDAKLLGQSCVFECVTTQDMQRGVGLRPVQVSGSVLPPVHPECLLLQLL